MREGGRGEGGRSHACLYTSSYVCMMTHLSLTCMHDEASVTHVYGSRHTCRHVSVMSVIRDASGKKKITDNQPAVTEARTRSSRKR